MVGYPSFAEISEIYSIVIVSFIIVSFCVVMIIFKRQGLTPVIRLSSSESILDDEVPGTVMVGVQNPYVLTLLHPEAATLKDGVQLKLQSSVACKMRSLWGVNCESLRQILYVQKRRLAIDNGLDDLFETALDVNETTFYEAGSTNELHLFSSYFKDDVQLGSPPRSKYPLVIIVTSINDISEAEQPTVLETLVVILHLPDMLYGQDCHVISQLIQTNTKQVYDLQRMFVAADTGPGSPEFASHDDRSDDAIGNCTICQNCAITRVILPCKHACSCDNCFPLLNMCPICRGYIYSYFRLGQDPSRQQENVVDYVDDNNLAGWFYRFNDWLNNVIGFT